MFSFLKKKDNEFKLDESSLPSLNDTNNSDLNSGNPTSDFQTQPNSNLGNSFDSTPKMDTNPIAFNSVPDLTPTNSQDINPNSTNQDLHNDLIKTKIDMLESKTQLIAAKINSIDEKLDVIYKLILSEVSDETKKKFKIESMMDEIKNN